MVTTLPLREVLTTILSLLLVLGTANSKTFFSVIQSRCSLTTSTNKIKVQVYIYRQSVCVHTHKRELLDLNSQHRAGLTFVQRSENTTISRPYTVRLRRWSTNFQLLGTENDVVVLVLIKFKSYPQL